MASTISVDNIIGKTATDNIHIPGHVVQTVHQRYTTPSVVATESFVYTGLSATITPKYNNSKIFIQGYLMGNGHSGNQEGHYFKLYRSIDGGSDSPISAADGNPAGSRIGVIAMMPGMAGDDEGMQTVPYDYLDSPSTNSTVIYKIYSKGFNSTNYFAYLNRSLQDYDRYHNARGVCTLTLMEIAQ